MPSEHVSPERETATTDAAECAPVPQVEDLATAERIRQMEQLPPAGWQAPLTDLVAAIVRRWALFLGIVLFGNLCGLLAYLFTPYYYQATAVGMLLPREKPAIDLAVEVGAFDVAHTGAQRRNTGPLMLPANTDLYGAILHSHAVMFEVARRNQRRLGYGDDRADLDRATRALDKMAKVTSTEEGVFEVRVQAGHPLLATELANSLMSEMRKVARQIETSMLARQIDALSHYIDKARTDLGPIESDLQAFYQEYGIVDMNLQADDVLNLIHESDLRRQDLEQQLIDRLNSYTEDDPGVKTLEERIAKYGRDVEQIKRNFFGNISADDYARVQVELERKRDALRHQRDLVSTLEAQHDALRLRADQPPSAIAVIRPAIANPSPAGPSRKKFVGLALLVSVILALATVILLEQWDGARVDPYVSKRIDEIVDAFERRKGGNP